VRDVSSLHRPSILTPSSTPHTLLNPIPYPLHNLSIPPPPTNPLLRIPLFDLRARHASPPTLNRTRYVLAPPSHIDTQSILEQVRRILPLVALELPRLPRRKDSNDAIPVVGLELLGGINQDEAKLFLCVD